MIELAVGVGVVSLEAMVNGERFVARGRAARSRRVRASRGHRERMPVGGDAVMQKVARQ